MLINSIIAGVSPNYWAFGDISGLPPWNTTSTSSSRSTNGAFPVNISTANTPNTDIREANDCKTFPMRIRGFGEAGRSLGPEHQANLDANRDELII